MLVCGANSRGLFKSSALVSSHRALLAPKAGGMNGKLYRFHKILAIAYGIGTALRSGRPSQPTMPLRFFS